MEKNVGGMDRWVRWMAGSALAVYGVQNKGWRRWLALSAAGSLLGTAAAKKCAISRWLGFNTHGETKSAKAKASEKVDEASEESFPASDVPAWSGGHIS